MQLIKLQEKKNKLSIFFSNHELKSILQLYSLNVANGIFKDYSLDYTSKNAILKPEKQKALEMHNIVRAHNENDPNGYVSNANLTFKKFKIIVLKSTLHKVKKKEYKLNEIKLENIFNVCHQVNNFSAYLVLLGIDKKKLYVTQFQIKVTG